MISFLKIYRQNVYILYISLCIHMYIFIYIVYYFVRSKCFIDFQHRSCILFRFYSENYPHLSSCFICRQPSRIERFTVQQQPKTPPLLLSSHAICYTHYKAYPNVAITIHSPVIIIANIRTTRIRARAGNVKKTQVFLRHYHHRRGSKRKKMVAAGNFFIYPSISGNRYGVR